MSDVLEQVKGIESSIAEFKTKTGATVEEQGKKLADIEKQLEGFKEVAKAADLADLGENMQKQFNELATKYTENLRNAPQGKSFNENLGEALEENKEVIKGLQNVGKGKIDATISMKAAGDMSYGTNFAGDSATVLTTEYRQNVLSLLEETLWLRNIIPGGTTNASSIWYPRHIGGEGSPAPWDYSTNSSTTAAKPLFDFDFDAVNAPVEWIAGIVRVPRQMLDDVAFLRSFLQANMLRKLFQAENNQILNGNGVSPNLQGLLPIADDYDGTMTIAVEKIIDAAYGQIVEAQGTPTHVLLHPRDAVAIALNKASGSGEYDLPNGSVGYVNGRLTIAGLTVVPTVQIARNNFLVGDMRATQFITRLAPELRFFDQNRDDAEKNFITIRIEERAALVTYYPELFVKGTLTA